jgi:hypothetical protein
LSSTLSWISPRCASRASSTPSDSSPSSSVQKNTPGPTAEGKPARTAISTPWSREPFSTGSSSLPSSASPRPRACEAGCRS